MKRVPPPAPAQQAQGGPPGLRWPRGGGQRRLFERMNGLFYRQREASPALVETRFVLGVRLRLWVPVEILGGCGLEAVVAVQVGGPARRPHP